MPLKLEDLQSTACQIVNQAPSFSGAEKGKHIFPDNGLQQDAMEDSLKTVGWCVAVSLPLAASTKTQASAGTNSPDHHGSSTHDVLFVVSIRTNPRKNAPDGIKLLAAVREVIKAFLSWKPSHGERGFFLPEQRAFEPDFEDVGNVTYDIRILKNVPL